jgi:hypothetical protein
MFKKKDVGFLKKYRHWQENRSSVFVPKTVKGVMSGQERIGLPAQECEPAPCTSCVPCGPED